jgi:hypothetical protein
MRIILLLMVVVAISVLWPSALSFGACPEDPHDNGICDTLYAEVYPRDTLFTGPGHLVRVLLYVTHDVPNPNIDSIEDFYMPLCYTHTNPSEYCSLSGYWNNTKLYGAWPPSLLERSIFRHIIEGGDTLIHNWMMDLSQQEPSYPAWSTTFLALNGTSDFRLILGRVIQPAFWEGSRVLLATMTFKVQDTTTVCIDSCFWAPSGHIAFSRLDHMIYVPRDNMPYCFSISYPEVGDVTADGVINLGDLVYLIGYLYRGGPAPNPLWLSDVTCNGIVDLGDVVFLISYLYKGGTTPSC